MRLGVRSNCLLKGIRETELKFILFVIRQPICLFLCCGVLHLSTYPLNQTVPLASSQGHCHDAARPGWCSELMKLRLKA